MSFSLPRMIAFLGVATEVKMANFQCPHPHYVSLKPYIPLLNLEIILRVNRWTKKLHP